MKLFRDNQAIDSQEELKTESKDTHYFIPVVVTSEKLTPGDYQLKLCGVAGFGPTINRRQLFLPRHRC